MHIILTPCVGFHDKSSAAIYFFPRRYFNIHTVFFQYSHPIVIINLCCDEEHLVVVKGTWIDNEAVVD